MLLTQKTVNDNNDIIFEGENKDGKKIKLTLASWEKGTRQKTTARKIWKPMDMSIVTPSGECYQVKRLLDERGRTVCIEVKSDNDDAIRRRMYYRDDPLKRDKRTEESNRSSRVFKHKGCWISDVIAIREDKKYNYYDIRSAKSSTPTGIEALCLLDKIETFFNQIEREYKPGDEKIECDDISFETERRDVFHIDDTGAPGVIFRRSQNQQGENGRNAAIVVPGGCIQEPSHELNKNDDEQLLAPVGVTDNNGNSMQVHNLSIEVATGDLQTKAKSYSIRSTDRGWQYWLAINKTMQKNGISDNWAELTTPEGREKYWENYGMDMDIAADGEVTLSDIPSAEKTKIKFNGKKVVLVAYDENGKPLDQLEYDCDTRIAIHHKINGEDEEWDIGAMLDLNKVPVDHGTQDDAGDYGSR